MKKYIEKLHFVTQDVGRYSHIDQVQLACEAGAKWIQYRCFSKNNEELLQDIHAIAEICDDWGTTLIVTDHIHLKGKADIQGFHIEDLNANFKAIRQELGDEFTLGGSATTIENIVRLAHEGADYAGFGPFARTSKPFNLLPLLAISAYSDAVKQFNKDGIDFPIVALGGVKVEDVRDLMDTGIHGVAISSAIVDAEDFIEAYEDFYQAVSV